MDIPTTEDEAKAHIREIRRAKGLDGPETNTSDLENALIILAEQLYQKSTHFLSELIQNADDNSYETFVPTLNITFTLSDRTLRIDCNEIGFGRSNVEAICKIGRSTKSSLGNSTRYIGEKGIGFKSVFKVADVVSISSGPYSFKFDKNQTLGMIAPIWSEFPDTRLPRNTSVLLQLSDAYDTREIEDELKSLDPRLLIFLRKLKQVNVMNYGKFGQLWKMNLGRNDVPSLLEGASRVELYQDTSSSQFEVIRFPVGNMPNDPKRQGCTDSEILLAFPIDLDGRPSIAAQKVYAFLPIRDHGFKFLMQADFLLIANREDIDVSSAWNRRLLLAIPEAFLRAVQIMNKGSLRYSWIRYLPERPPLSDFFENLDHRICGILSRNEIMESLSGCLCTPRMLRFVPPEFRDKEDLPLIQTGATVSRYLSSQYVVADKTAYIRLGVQELSCNEFVEDLQSFVSNDPETFQEMPAAWHCSLSDALIHAIHRDPRIKEKVLGLAIIPLKDGQWVASSQQQTCFASPSEDPKIPRGIPMSDIDPQAVSHPSRRNLFILLGAKTYSKDLVCAVIVNEQGKPDFNPDNLNANELISHVVFLYEAGWKNTGKHDLWVVTKDGSTKRGSKTYADSSQEFSARSLLEDLSTQWSDFNFLHKGYSDAIQPTDGSWTAWLREHLFVAEYPHLVLYTSPKLVLTREFRVLAAEENVLRLLLLLRDRWNDYSKYFVSNDQPEIEETPKAQFRERMAALAVPCQGGGRAPLRHTVLPLTELMPEATTSTTFLHIPTPDDSRWKFLRHFGVVVELGVSQYLAYVRQLKQSGASLKRVTEIYEQMQPYASAKGEEITDAFEAEELIYIPPRNHGSNGTWVQPSFCVWNGPEWLRKTPCLKDTYPGLYSFFWVTMGIKNSSWVTVVNEAKCLNASDDVDYIAKVFKAINSSLEEAEVAAIRDVIVESLKTACIFPISAGKSNSLFDYMSTAQDLEMWFIADRWHLKKSFDGIIPILALDVDTIEKIQVLISALGLNHRLLSWAAGENAKVNGITEPHQTFTVALREKAKHIARLLSKDNPARKEIISQLCNFAVHTSEEVVVQWAVKMNDEEIFGRADSGRVKCARRGRALDIYLVKADADAGKAPFELREYLGKLCGLDRADHLRLLDFILSEPDLGEIDDQLSRRGFSKLVPELEQEKIDSNDLSRKVIERPRDTQADARRQFYGRKPDKTRYSTRGAGSEYPDHIQAFLEKFSIANSFRDQVSKPWAEAEASMMLAHLCKLENIDPWMLLPQKRNDWDNFFKYHGKAPATVYQDSEQQLRISVSTAIENKVDDDTLFAAELFVSRLFEKHMGTAFVPEAHWTSPLRSKAGLLPYLQDDKTVSSFTIDDNQCAFSSLLARHGYKKGTSFGTSTTFHVEVIPSDGDLCQTFCLDHNQVHKAWQCHVSMNKAPILYVYVLVRIVNVRSKPETILFVDPWQLHSEGLLDLHSISQHQASLKPEAKGILLNGPGQADNSKQGRSLGNVFHRKKHRSVTRTPSPQPQDMLYQYEQMNFKDIRILELLPGKEETPLAGELRHVNIEKEKKYFALSYVWGPAMVTSLLTTSRGWIPLTTSLTQGLKRIRKEKESIFVWADAICINQTDDHEKAEQIRKLPKIFSSAEAVLGWIGNGSGTGHDAIQTLLQIRTLDISPAIWPEELQDVPDTWRNGMPAPKDDAWWAIKEMFTRGWFSRAWVIQEAVLARELRLIYGQYEVAWDDIFKALEICFNNIDLFRSDSYLRQILPFIKPAYSMGRIRQAYEHKRLSHPFALLDLLDTFHYAKSTKECDRLFSMLGIAYDASHPVYDPDYSSSLEYIVRRYAADFVDRGKGLDLLYRAGHCKGYKFCSWIPNWTGSEPCRTISTWRGREGVFSAAAATYPRIVINGTNSKLLSVSGMHVDTVSRTSSLSMLDSEIIAVVNDAHTMIDALDAYPTGEPLAQVKLKAPIGNAVSPCTDDLGSSIDDIVKLTDVEARFEVESAFEWDDNYMAVHSVHDIIHLLQQPRDRRENSWKYWTTAATFMKRLSDGRFFVTKKGYVGIGPPETKVGDWVFMMDGGAVPFLVSTIESHIQVLVGEAYVHGMMYGESLSLEGGKKLVLDLA